MFHSYSKMIGAAAMTAMMLFGSLAIAGDDKQPVGAVSIQEKELGLIIGGSKGSGTLTFQGEEHQFKLKGISLGANVGMSKMSASGEVYDLTNVSEFPGTYTKLDASVALGGGMGGLRLKNQNGVILVLHSRTQGVDLNLGSMSGMTVTME
ncbi:hypothetical protein Thiosp_04790 [Thiorhodovibrio litoralis]|nr:DUF1134 domain-containing protein [Thiorhodovibrio winogradskyi]WPL14934.1 hypothetical protein Thiosp_04790 [Thiorhodovibrio litoralis]